MTQKATKHRFVTERSIRWLILGLGVVGVLLAVALLVAYVGM